MKSSIIVMVFLTLFTAGNAQPVFTVLKIDHPDLNNRQRAFDLPFIEDWSSNSFETNNWTIECENWVTTNFEGHETPSAEFQWNPTLQDNYSCSLVSDVFNADNIQAGNIYLDFEYKLDNRNNTGTEKLSIDVFNGSEWNTVAECSNAGSDTDWMAQHLDITDYVLESNFQIRFNANGQNSYNILAWFIDNIEIYRECDAPYDLDAWTWYDDGPAIQVEWRTPASTIVKDFNWLYWDNGNYYNGFSTADGSDFSVAARWNSAQLADYSGDTINSIKLFLHDNGFEIIVLKIWKGEDADNLIYIDTIENPSIGVWLEYSIDTTLIIDASTDYWVGYSVYEPSPGMLPVGVDSGPAVEGFGDMIYHESIGWRSMSDFGYDFNFNIRIKLLNSVIADTNCIGFNIYRMDVSDPSYSFIYYTPFIVDQEDYHYIDEDVEENITFCYKVNAIWANGSDTCISPYAKSIVPIDDYTCVIFPIGIKESMMTTINLYPNPSKNKITINSENEIFEISVLKFQGQLILGRKADWQKQYTLDIQFLDPGLYFLKVKTKAGVSIRKFVKME